MPKPKHEFRAPCPKCGIPASKPCPADTRRKILADEIRDYVTLRCASCRHVFGVYAKDALEDRKL